MVGSGRVKGKREGGGGREGGDHEERQEEILWPCTKDPIHI